MSIQSLSLPMIVRAQIAALLLAAGLLLGAGCGGKETVFTAETDDPYYREGQRLVKQGREAEALAAFLKVIEKRGEQASAESHLEAGLICLNHIKDPIEAIHHFRKYLELQPNAKQAPGVRGLIDTAKREFARTLPAHPQESQPIGLEQSDVVRRLQQENDDLRTELAAQKNAGLVQLLRSSHATVDADETSAAPRPAEGLPLITPAPVSIRLGNPAPVVTSPPPTNRSASPSGVPSLKNASAGGKKYTVAPHDTLYGISKRFSVKVEEIVAANRDAFPNGTMTVHPGLELKIP